MAKRVSDVFRDTKIWKHFIGISDPDKVTMVNELVEYAIPILDRIIETFPTYTLHNGQHQLNILNLYGELLGTRMKDLSSLESAILILAAFYHDIGMVYSEEEREYLEREDQFEEFLNTHPRAKLIYSENGVDNELAEWFCRSQHAMRVWVYLNKVSNLLNWGGMSLREPLAKVCLSHNEDTEYIKSDELSSSFWDGADLKFCSILLRLADILDFDNTRSPVSVYEFLQLDLAKSGLKEVSHKEWSKHLDSKGFIWNKWNLDNNYPLGFMAAPRHPAVQNDIIAFLDSIETECAKCSMIMRYCSDNWHGFKLPEKILRNNIISQGYTYGQFEFSLDKHQILNLLMGENLYANPNIFIRELLQNALDTSSHRVFHERCNGNIDYEPGSIEVNDWYDEEGYRWVSIDDFGMGMTLSQVSDYFLNIGNSYYNSDEFKVKKLAYQQKDIGDFTPVSRFGIGILSCFIVGDLVEVSTNAIDKESLPIRLTLTGMNNFYFLFTNSDIPKSMPGPSKKAGYLSKTGTSLAVRLKPNYDTTEFDLEQLVLNTVYNPCLNINVNNKTILKRQKTNRKPSVRVHNLNPKQTEQLVAFCKSCDIYGYQNMRPKVHVVELPLEGIDQDITGTLVIIMFRLYLKENDQYKMKLINNFFKEQKWQLNDSGQLSLKIMHNSKLSRGSEKVFYLEFNKLFENGILKKQNIRLDKGQLELLLTHNSVTIPNSKQWFENQCQVKLKLTEIDSAATITLGHIGLDNMNRPNLNVSRDKLISISWHTWLVLNYVIKSKLELIEYKFSEHTTFFHETDLNVLLDKSFHQNESELLQSEFWPKVLRLLTESEELIGLDEIQEDVYLKRPFYRDQLLFRELIDKLIVFQKFEYTLILFQSRQHLYGSKNFELRAKISPINNTSTINSKYCLPFTFCLYENFVGLAPRAGRIYHKNNTYPQYFPFNVNHQFSQWLIANYDFLHIRYQNHLNAMLFYKDWKDINIVLKKLGSILPINRKPKFRLKESDFIVKHDKLPIHFMF